MLNKKTINLPNQFLQIFTVKWMELENIILSEVSLAQKTKNPMFSLTTNTTKGKHNKGIGL
jgi:hypothetical protein